jgi:hypothetical protein
MSAAKLCRPESHSDYDDCLIVGWAEKYSPLNRLILFHIYAIAMIKSSAQVIMEMRREKIDFSLVDSVNKSIS